MHLPSGLPSHLSSPLPSLKNKTKTTGISHKKFSETVGMDPSNTSQTRWEWHHNTFNHSNSTNFEALASWINLFVSQRSCLKAVIFECKFKSSALCNCCVHTKHTNGMELVWRPGNDSPVHRKIAMKVLVTATFTLEHLLCMFVNLGVTFQTTLDFESALFHPIKNSQSCLHLPSCGEYM